MAANAHEGKAHCGGGHLKLVGEKGRFPLVPVAAGDEAATFLRKLLKAVTQGAEVGVFEAGFTLIYLGFGEQVLGALDS